ncbi:MAG TPA: hypothetical protein VLE72_00215 [Candidatus Saccharimonadales bacterium]|nr:hypothetical protein [Candidatus Saccharimonadales bacterium]
MFRAEKAKMRQSSSTAVLARSATSGLKFGALGLGLAFLVMSVLFLHSPQSRGLSVETKPAATTESAPQVQPVNVMAVANAAAQRYKTQQVQIWLWAANPEVQNHQLLESLKGPSPWDGVARCEEQGNWHFQGLIFGGGLGMNNRGYKAFVHGLTPSGERRWSDLVAQFRYPELPGLASREQQLVVAERWKTWNHGTATGAWGCAPYYGA